MRTVSGRSGAVAAVLAVSLGLAWCEAAAQVLYKWTDAEGKVQYSDRAPKNFTGAVTRLEPDEQPVPSMPTPGKPLPGATAVQVGEERPAAPDSAGQRRALRLKLEYDVALARRKLESARAALEASPSPQDDERQVIQQKREKGNPAPGPGSASTGGMLGSGAMHGGTPRSNCRTVKGNDGKTITTCPTAVPNDAFYDRINALEEAVTVAEKELAAAEQAYRRGVD